MADSSHIDGVETLSTHIGERLPRDVAPLYESIDPDALNELFDKNDTDGTVQFNHAGYRIVVQFENGSPIVIVEYVAG